MEVTLNTWIFTKPLTKILIKAVEETQEPGTEELAFYGLLATVVIIRQKEKSKNKWANFSAEKIRECNLARICTETSAFKPVHKITCLRDKR